MTNKSEPRNFAAELAAARAAEDWVAHARIWDERSSAEVAHDEAVIATHNGSGATSKNKGILLRALIDLVEVFPYFPAGSEEREALTAAREAIREITGRAA